MKDYGRKKYIVTAEQARQFAETDAHERAHRLHEYIATLRNPHLHDTLWIDHDGRGLYWVNVRSTPAALVLHRFGPFETHESAESHLGALWWSQWSEREIAKSSRQYQHNSREVSKSAGPSLLLLL